MSEKKYSSYTCAKYLGMSNTAIVYRAKKLGVKTSDGISAKELKRIAEFKSTSKMRHKGKLDDLKKEMEALG